MVYLTFFTRVPNSDIKLLFVARRTPSHPVTNACPSLTCFFTGQLSLKIKSQSGAATRVCECQSCSQQGAGGSGSHDAGGLLGFWAPEGHGDPVSRPTGLQTLTPLTDRAQPTPTALSGVPYLSDHGCWGATRLPSAFSPRRKGRRPKRPRVPSRTAAQAPVWPGHPQDALWRVSLDILGDPPLTRAVGLPSAQHGHALSASHPTSVLVQDLAPPSSLCGLLAGFPGDTLR